MLPVAAVQSAAQAVVPVEDKAQENTESLPAEETVEETQDADSEETPKLAEEVKTPSGKTEETPSAPTGEEQPDAPEKPTTPEPADRWTAVEAANVYAAAQYGVSTDGGLTLDNSAYRFPASVAADASQETLEAKARDMVDYTFCQLMMQAGVDTLAVPRWERIATSLRAAKQVPLGYSSE